MTDIAARRYTDLDPVDMFPGVVRRLLASGDRLSLVEIRIATGANVPEHSHPHEQSGQVASGRVHFRIGEQQFDLEPGDSYLIPSNVPHYVEAADAAILIEAFSPVREDFLTEPE